MKRLIAASLASLCIALSAHAEDSSCKKISALAGQAMTARQNGQLLEDSLDKIGDGSKFARSMILKAYERPVAIVDRNKTEAINEFRNDAFRQCLDANG
ncbi:hypothetical protein CQ009_12845 [Pseudomonas sp. MYb2]|uniref:hypothetical protein n=1 Tax=unclassified Pseudomonas TaxID=196821 RepID=UPI000CFFF03D|nr:MULTISPECIES: hypothetical protein [unclassified Pseudomonas]PRB51166.1 hypothetical protein CQ025_09490 [Pseudomonas sp. MYb3]PRC34545.1 hypothetical protein CQ009_12845 [Pseudomonas sp. MYb2]